MTLTHGTPGLLALALLLAACGDNTQSTTFSSQTETGPGPTTVTPTSTGTPTTTGGPDTSSTTDATSTGGTTMSVLTGSTGDSSSTGSSTTGPLPCAEDTIVCDAGSAKVCDGAGGYKSEEACPDACVDGVGCKPCAPDTFQCVDELSQKCSNNYEWVDYETCDPVQGVNCDAGTGACIGTCSKADLGTSYGSLRQMRVLPFATSLPSRLTVAVLVPVAPLVLTMVPLEELLGRLARMIL